ncbi:DnaJ-domain-containing protein [Cucurbitaria berberidis CBS 394.84]|uniref:DnaJ-domain-containing protein n=1 Tax=Cucurbitaria berberidis CBS 394.84 TaxID=1168544 RepID=A0A9P4L7W4_9PLEO|nr:DnaJ-domain-containing protein [Cucurbitaria berberidis CBS 394.84]KAF1844714.1 DnaJ-domain-containing protein [Cucurbitaria berberidis CBS 394.84]
MAPSLVTEDYYMILEVGQTATPELIIRSYRRLALKLHPDRNAKHDATEAFQLLGKAYETLKDENKRRAYDIFYPSINRSRPFPQTTGTPRSPPSALSEATQIAAIQKLKQERGVRWLTKKNVLDSSIYEVQRVIRRLEQEIKNLDSIAAAEAATEAKKNSWGTWLLSPIYKKVEDSEEEKARKDRGRQERRIEKDMKERRLALKKAALREEQSLLEKAKEAAEAADFVDDGNIRLLQQRIWAREASEKQEKEKVERERQARIRKEQQEQQEKRNREAAEARFKQLAEEQKRSREVAEALRRRQRQNIFLDAIRNRQKQYTHVNTPEESNYQSHQSVCRHDGWWPKVQGRTECPTCTESWTYLLQCPDCSMKACPRCQHAIRPKRGRRNPPRARTPSPDYSYDTFY